MRAAGIFSQPLGKNLDSAIEQAEALNRQWDSIRDGSASSGTDPGSAHGTFNWLVDSKLRTSAEWRDKAPRTIEELDYALAIIQPIFGPSRLDRIKPDDCRIFYDTLRDQGSLHRAAKVYKWLRYLFNFAVRTGHLATNPTWPFVSVSLRHASPCGNRGRSAPRSPRPRN